MCNSPCLLHDRGNPGEKVFVHFRAVSGHAGFKNLTQEVKAGSPQIKRVPSEALKIPNHIAFISEVIAQEKGGFSKFDNINIC
jgi:hypothetical protein